MPVGSVRFRSMMLDCVRFRSVHFESGRSGLVRFDSARFGDSGRRNSVRRGGKGGREGQKTPRHLCLPKGVLEAQSVVWFDSTAGPDVFFFVPEVRTLPLCHTQTDRLDFHTTRTFAINA